MHIGHCKNQNANRAQLVIPLGIVAGFSTLGFCGTAYNALAEGSSTDITVNCNIAPTISIAALSNSLNITTDPSGVNALAPGIFGLANTTIRVSTNSPYGYTLSMGMAAGSTNNQLNLTSPSTSIPSIQGATVGSNFSSSTGGWGYMVGNGSAVSTYMPIPNVNHTDTLKVASVPRSNDDTPVTVGVKPSATAPKGVYSNTLTFSAATNNVPASKTLNYIDITSNPATTSYTAGQNFDPTGMIITAYYSDGTTAVINAGSGGYTVTNGTNLAAGTTYVTISYTYEGVTRTVNVSITVSAAKSGGGDTGGSSNAPARSTSPLLSANRNALSSESESSESSSSSSSADSTDGKAEAAGVRDSATGSGMDTALAVALGATAVTAASGIFFIILLAKRDDDDDEEEEQASQQ